MQLFYTPNKATILGAVSVNLWNKNEVKPWPLNLNWHIQTVILRVNLFVNSYFHWCHVSNDEEVTSALISGAFIAACYSNTVKIWKISEKFNQPGKSKRLNIGDIATQIKFLRDTLYILTKSGIVQVFSLRLVLMR